MECVTSAFEVWTHLPLNLVQWDEISRSELERGLKRDDIIELSIKNRLLVVPPEHYFCLIQSAFDEVMSDLIDRQAVGMLERFESNVRHIPTSVLQVFKDEFFDFREIKFREQSDSDWVAENPITPFAKELSELLDYYQAEVFILSRKNYSSLSKWVAGSNFRVDKIFGNEELTKFGESKFRLISNIQRQLPCDAAVFIDDMEFELDSAGWLDIGVKTFVAGWGYNKLADNTSEIIESIRNLLSDSHN